MPYDIQIRLKRLRMTQRNLLDEVRKNGFSQLSESLFSSILTGSYSETTYADAILKTADKLLTQHEQKGAQKDG